MIKVMPKAQDEETMKQAITNFMKLCNKDGFLKEIYDRRYYKKPSELKREQQKEYKKKFKK